MCRIGQFPRCRLTSPAHLMTSGIYRPEAGAITRLPNTYDTVAESEWDVTRVPHLDPFATDIYELA